MEKIVDTKMTTIIDITKLLSISPSTYRIAIHFYIVKTSFILIQVSKSTVPISAKFYL